MDFKVSPLQIRSQTAQTEDKTMDATAMNITMLSFVAVFGEIRKMKRFEISSEMMNKIVLQVMDEKNRYFLFQSRRIQEASAIQLADHYYVTGGLKCFLAEHGPATVYDETARTDIATIELKANENCNAFMPVMILGAGLKLLPIPHAVFLGVISEIFSEVNRTGARWMFDSPRPCNRQLVENYVKTGGLQRFLIKATDEGHLHLVA